MAGPVRPPGTPNHPGAAHDLPAAVGQAARDRAQLKASEAEVTSGVIALQLARERLGLATPDVVTPLTEREREVLALVAAGASDGEIAARLFISKKTASVHVANIKGKLGATTRVEIAVVGARLGLVEAVDGAPVVHDGVHPARAVVCPFKGLASFEPDDASYFFGRETVVAQMIARLAGSTSLAVIGPSGSGKSSLLRAGLIPALRDGVLPGSDRWAWSVIRPGFHPMDRLWAALDVPGPTADATPPDDGQQARSGGYGDPRRVLVVDQFEEAFSLCDDDVERTAFLDALTALADDPDGGTLVVIAVRADFVGRCAQHRGIAAMLSSSAVVLGPMSADEVARAIELPARAAGLRIEPLLVTALVDDVTAQPGGLPLLASTLIDLWQRRDGRVLRLETYRTLGGVSGAVARMAEAAYAELTPAQQDVARAVLLRLTTTGPGDIAVRRRIELSELGVPQDADVAAVIEALAAHRLLTIDDDTVEPAHEALLLDWPRMRTWIEEDAEGRRVRERLRVAAREWEAGGREPGDLYRGSRLSVAAEWSRSHRGELNQLERGFLAESRAASERSLDEQRRSNGRLRRLLVLAVALTVVASLAGLGALSQAETARLQAALASNEASAAAAAAGEAITAQAEADQQRLMARARELAAQSDAVSATDATLSKLLMVAAADTAKGAVTETDLHRIWMADRSIERVPVVADTIRGLNGNLDPTGRFMVATGGGGGFSVARELRVIDLDTRQQLWSSLAPGGPDAQVDSAFFTPDGALVVAGATWHPGTQQAAPGPPTRKLGVMVFDARTGTLLRTLDVGPCGGDVFAVSNTSALTETASAGGAPNCYSAGPSVAEEVIDLTTGATSRPLATSNSPGGAMTPDGRYVAYVDPDANRAIVRDMSTGKIHSMPAQYSAQQNGAVQGITDDGRLLIYGDRPVLAIDVSTGTVEARLQSGPDVIDGLSVGRDGLVYISVRDGVLRVIDPTTGDLVRQDAGVGGGQPSASSDGSRVLVTDFAKDIATVIGAQRGEVATVSTCRGWLAPAGQLAVHGAVAAFSVDCPDASWTYLVDRNAFTVQAKVEGNCCQSIALSSDGTKVAVQTATGNMVGGVGVFDARTGQRLRWMAGTCTYDSTSNDPLHYPGCYLFPATPFAFYAENLVFSPDGRWLVGDGFNATVIWDVATGDVVKLLPNWAIAEAFTPDSTEWIADFVHDPAGPMILKAFSTATWEPTATRGADPNVEDRGNLGFIGFSPDGKTLMTYSGGGGYGGGWVQALDVATLAFVRSFHVSDATIKSAALSPDDRQIATGSSDGSVRVWDAATGTLQQELNVPEQAQGVAFLGNDELAIVPQAGDMLVMTLDPDRLLATVRASLTRTFTTDECTQYRITPCPSLAEMQAGTWTPATPSMSPSP
jgi:WD40 repeat protein/DNA-binding CsgD family transcriptional regulator